jgi:hypothetical protein
MQATAVLVQNVWLKFTPAGNSATLLKIICYVSFPECGLRCDEMNFGRGKFLPNVAQV